MFFFRFGSAGAPVGLRVIPQPRVPLNRVPRTHSGEVLVEIAVASASLDFGWVVPWDSNLAKVRCKFDQCSGSRGSVWRRSDNWSFHVQALVVGELEVIVLPTSLLPLATTGTTTCLTWV